MEILKRSLVAAAGILLSAGGLSAQEAEAPATFGPWSLACAERAEGEELCELRQAIGNDQGQEILRLAFGAAGENGRELAIRTPQGVLLPAPVELAPLEDTAEITASYRTCLNQICIARTVVQDAQLTALTEADQPSVRFLDRSGRQIRVIVSLDSLMDGLAALDAR